MVEQWPPDYRRAGLRRAYALEVLRKNREAALDFYSKNAVRFIEDFCVTVDPRNAGSDLPTKMPFILFEKQREYVTFLQQCLENGSHGLVEKSRDMGATWASVAFSVWLWRFWDNAAIGFGSRKEMLVDRLGDMDSIFEKIRATVSNLPIELAPSGFRPKQHSTYMKLMNPENGASITGEAGDNIGRGGRKLIYFKDESAHYDHPEMIEAALMDNTNVQIDISSVNGVGNVFYRRRQGGTVWHGEIENPRETQVFIFDWRDHPAKTQQWYDDRKAKAEADGLLAQFAQEVDRDYAAAVLGTIIKPEWIEAAIGFAEDFEIEVSGKRLAALDVADDGVSGDKNAFAAFYGIELQRVDVWGQIDTSQTANRAVMYCREFGANELMYDSIGVGAGVKGEINQMGRRGDLPRGFKTVSWVASGKVQNPHAKVNWFDEGGMKNKDFFQNMKAQAWWAVRQRFYETWKCRQGMDYDAEQVISISRQIKSSVLQELVAELSQPVRKESMSGKMIVDKSPHGARSPNMADAFVMAAFPAHGPFTESQEVRL